MAVLDDLVARGVIDQSTDPVALRDLMSQGPATFYVGFDPTAPSLHQGHLMQLITAMRLQRDGHVPILLVGGATGLIGDPKASAERTLNSYETVDTWSLKLRAQIDRFLSRTGANAAIEVNNMEWTGGLTALEFLRDLGQHFRVGKMLSKEAVSARLNSSIGISYTEFSYQILQANDFLELRRRYGCTIQLGGSDQWGNITAGLDLIGRHGLGPCHAIATRLMTKADGTKFGKTEGGAVWLDPELTSPFAFYQFWLNVADEDAPGLLRSFSLRPLEDISAMEERHASRPAAREMQRALAEEMTALVHGPAELERAVRATSALFGTDDLGVLEDKDLEAITTELPTVTGAVARGLTFADVFLESGLSSSRGDARRTAAQNGLYFNNVLVTDVEKRVSGVDFAGRGVAVLRKGKKSVAATRP